MIPFVREPRFREGRSNGAVVPWDLNTGRILTVVNQKIAFGRWATFRARRSSAYARDLSKKYVITPRTPCFKVGRRKT